MGVSKVTGVADSAPSFSELLSFVLMAYQRITVRLINSRPTQPLGR
jgi:hypothetical protein